MRGRRVLGVGCLVLACLMLVANVGVLSPAAGEPGPGVSRAIGVFLLPLVLAILGLKLLQKPKGV